jgi:hypothetical protein
LNVGKEEERSEEEQIAQLEQDFRREEMELGRLEWAWQFLLKNFFTGFSIRTLGSHDLYYGSSMLP